MNIVEGLPKLNTQTNAIYEACAKGKHINSSFKSITQVEQVLLVDDLKHNLLSISQLCDEENIIIFEHDKCIIKSSEIKETRFVAQCHKTCTFFS